MAFDLQQTVDRLGEKSRFLVERYKVVAGERDEALRQVAELREELRARNRELQELRMRVEYLTVVSTIAPDREAVDKTRAVIAKMMRDIDRCLADLSVE